MPSITFESSMPNDDVEDMTSFFALEADVFMHLLECTDCSHWYGKGMRASECFRLCARRKKWEPR